MNLKLSQKEIRVRLERADAEALARGEPLASEVQLPGGPLRWRIDPSPAPPGVAFGRDGLTVSVSGEAVQELLKLPPSKDLAIRAAIGEVELVVEIDLWSGKKR